ncbi:MAG: BlaI/MecI/CopY family transcriptional regulator [Acidobacteria bacterium]|nr:BlaI/MecI/CopY family transcriptional regulator [Acidobacteriota bacterium]
MSRTPWHSGLSRRERQIMDILFRLGRATASVVRAELAGDPSSSTVRTQLRILEQKGHVRHDEEGLRYVYRPVTPRRAARRSALRHLVETFFDGSAEQAVTALLGGEARRLTEPELERIARIVSDARAGQRSAGRSPGGSRAGDPDAPDGGGQVGIAGAADAREQEEE